MAVAVTTTTMVFEILGGIWTGSLALLSDAGHMLTHAAALGVSLAAILFAGRTAHPQHTFGNYRVEVLAALLNAATLLLITVVILREAWLRLLDPLPVLGWQMFFVAVLGLLVNLLTAWLLHDVGRQDLNVRGAFLHMLGDTLSSLVVVVGAVVIALTQATWIDPVLSVVVCLVILIWAWGLGRDSVRILMEAAPAGVDLAKLRQKLLEEPSVEAVCDLHVWTITSGMHASEARLTVGGDPDLKEIQALCHRLRHELEEHFGIGHVIIECVPAVEPPVASGPLAN
jgi:cobalt-zinc-cadmium efflux system protein